MRKVMTRVFPLPAPARMSTGPSVVSTASRCCGFNSSRNDKGGWLRSALDRFYRRNEEGISKSHGLQRGHFPLKRPKLGDPAEISFVGRDHANAHSGRAHRNQRVICQASLADLL